MARKKKGDPIHGWICFDKPLEMTSTAAVGKIRWLFQAQKAGHAGTLDPLATGVLPIALGEATKTVPYLMEADKVYSFTIAFGTTTDSFDAEGRVTATFEIVTLSGWKPHESQQKPLRPGSAKMRLADALGVRENKL